MSAFADALERDRAPSTPRGSAIPADRKWVRNLAVAKVLHHTLTAMKPRYPAPAEGVIGDGRAVGSAQCRTTARS